MGCLDLNNARRNSFALIFITALIFSFSFILFSTQSAYAAFPGGNGKIAFMNYQDGEGEIFVMNPDGTGVTQLTSNTVSDAAPAWSADGSKIVFQRHDGNDWEIWSMNADGSNQQQLASDDDDDELPAWSPDGSKIVYQKFTVPPDNWDIYVMNADGSGQTKLYDSGHNDEMPVWSPDGSKIALIQYDSDSNTDQIWVINADGTNPTQLTSPPDNMRDAAPDWAPDDSKIVFESDRTGDTEVWMMNSDGTNQHQVTFNDVLDFRPAWAPDGSKIVFASDVTGEQGGIEIVVMNPDGSDQIQLTLNDVPDDNPDWRALPTLFVIIFDTEPTNMGTITFNSTDYSDGENVTRQMGNYTISANPVTGYTFSRWETSGLITVSNSTSSSTNCTVNGLGTIKLVQTEITTPPPTTPTPPPTSGCIIVTATYGSEMAPEVTYMRQVRDEMIASNQIGEVLVAQWNTFYYSWSPPIAHLISTQKMLQQISQALILPLIAVIHGTASIYSNIAYLNLSIASLVAFLFASIASTTIYIITPFYGVRIIQKKVLHKKSAR